MDEDTEDTVDNIPLENLGDSGLTVFRYELSDNPDDPVPPNNVLINGLDRFKRVSVVGEDRETGHLYYASSTDNYDLIMQDLKHFMRWLQFSQQFMDDE